MQVPGYEVERLLGQGNMASAYLARGLTDKRSIVLKVLHLNGRVDRELLKRFMQEYKIVARLTHRHVVHIEERGFGSDFAFIAMEYCPFGSLKARIKRGVNVREALELTRQIADGLGAVHAIGVTHRDMKPANLLFRDPQTLVVTDFGVAKDFSSDQCLTARGSFLGSVYYCSPEQILHQDCGPLSDLYSVGIILFQMLTGRPPYTGQSAAEVMNAHLHCAIPRLPAPLAAIQPLIEGLLAKDPSERFQTTLELASGIAWTSRQLAGNAASAQRNERQQQQ